ncbi:MAG: AMP-binding protein, partial [Deltaproteobacteria bacterium]
MARNESPTVAGFANQLLAAVRNGVEIARFGGLGEREGQPYEVVAHGPNHRLRRYFPEGRNADAVPVVLVPPLMLTAEVWDVAPGTSAVEALRDQGVDPWVVDFGSPEKEEGGLRRNLSDHVLAVGAAVDAILETTGRPVHLMGYSQGGMFAYQAAAYRRSAGIASLVTFGAPVDLHRAILDRVPMEFVLDLIGQMGQIESALLPSGIPRWATRLGFKLLDPIKTVQQRFEFLSQLADREALLKREGMRRFMENEGWTAFPGPALRDAMRDLVAHNRLLRGGAVIGDRTVTLADITCPILAFSGASDTIAPPPSVRAIRSAAPRAQSWEIRLQTGHFGMVAGSRAQRETWPAVADWVRWQEGQGSAPAAAHPLVESEAKAPAPSGFLVDLQRGAGTAWHLGVDLLGGAGELAVDRLGGIGRIISAVAPQALRISRLDAIRVDTRISPGLALEAKAAEVPKDTFFLFEGRAYSYAGVNTRIDNIVLGFLVCGVRHGQHVGVLMETRPSALAATVALSRLGAVAVLLRPDVSLAKQLEIAPVDHLLADPECADDAYRVLGREVLVLGGGGTPRVLGAGIRDMEAIDPAEVTPPEWYTPNPGLAGELSIVLITGSGDRLGVNRVTNRRWSTSAYGTASATALSANDTVYCCSPTYHATGILVCVGAALVSGARLALTREFAPASFWEDVRRYGVNVVFYTGTLCRGLVNAPPDPREHDHSIRLFAGSGMPRGIWQRLIERLHPAPAIEFFASTEGNAVLVNLTGEKIGSIGKPLPGGAEIAVAAWDIDRAALVELESGFA